MAALVRKGGELDEFVDGIKYRPRIGKHYREHEWFKGRIKEIVSISMASFDPIDPQVGSPRTFITSTPKPGWTISM